MTLQADAPFAIHTARDSAATIWHRAALALSRIGFGGKARSTARDDLERAVCADAYREEARRRVDNLLR